MNVAISETGTVSNGISVARQFCRKIKTTRKTSRTASKRVEMISLMLSSTARVVSSEISWTRSGGKAFRLLVHRILDFRTSSAFVPGIWKTAMTAAGLPLWRLAWLYSSVPSSIPCDVT